MVEFNIKKTGVGFYYFPKELRRAITNNIVILPNNCAAIMYPEGADLEDVSNSVERLLAEVKIRVIKERK